MIVQTCSNLNKNGPTDPSKKKQKGSTTDQTNALGVSSGTLLLGVAVLVKVEAKDSKFCKPPVGICIQQIVFDTLTGMFWYQKPGLVGFLNEKKKTSFFFWNGFGCLLMLFLFV